MGNLNEILKRPVKTQSQCKWVPLSTYYINLNTKIQLVFHEWDGRMGFKVNGKIRKNSIDQSTSIIRLDYKGRKFAGFGDYWSGVVPTEKIIELTIKENK